MKKCDLRKMALMGLSSGLLITNQLSAQTERSNSPFQSSDTVTLAAGQCSASGNGCSPKSNSQTKKDNGNANDPNNGNMNYHVMTEEELLIELNPQGITMYNKLTPEGKALARKLASMMCNGTNPCKGLNSCQTSNNDCAGKGECKGKGKCAISDKNLAIKLVNEKMAGKREAATRKPQ